MSPLPTIGPVTSALDLPLLCMLLLKPTGCPLDLSDCRLVFDLPLPALLPPPLPRPLPPPPPRGFFLPGDEDDDICRGAKGVNNYGSTWWNDGHQRTHYKQGFCLAPMWVK